MVHGNNQAVIPAIGIGTHGVHAVVVRVDQQRAGVERRGERPHLVAGSVVDQIGVDLGRRGEIRVISGGDMQAAAPDIGNRQAGVLCQFTLDGNLRLLRVGVPEILGVELNGRRIGLAAGTASRESSGNAGPAANCAATVEDKRVSWAGRIRCLSPDRPRSARCSGCRTCRSRRESRSWNSIA